MFSVVHCIVSASGIRPDPKKIESITQAPHPYYCSRYTTNYSTITQPLRELTKSNATFQWNEAQEAAFQKLKTTIGSAPVLAHYNLNAPTKLVVDASPWAVGTILLLQQPDTNYRPVAYGSRSLTSTEVKYGHIEREALALVYGCEHFHMYLYGRKFELEYALVLIDYYSRWAEVEITTTTTTTKSAKVLKWLDFVCKPWLSSHITNRQRKIFHLCRIPTHPQSMGNQAPYCHVIEYCPQVNGFVERFNKILLKFIHTSLAEERNWMVMKSIIQLKMTQNLYQHLCYHSQPIQH